QFQQQTATFLQKQVDIGAEFMGAFGEYNRMKSRPYSQDFNRTPRFVVTQSYHCRN
ncbi:hypothetical protein DPMN_165162, partial [Dreissena polymorpha]